MGALFDVQPATNDVINAIFTYLGITLAPPLQPSPLQQILIFILDGSAHALITDPLGRSLSISGGTIYSVNAEGQPEITQGMDNEIPGAEYISFSGNPFQIINIPDPVAGEYIIEVSGTATGRYLIGLLDTFSNLEHDVVQFEDLWDFTRTQSTSDQVWIYKLTYDPDSESKIPLLAATPLIETPAWLGSTLVHGKALPDTRIEIRDYLTGAVLGEAIAGEDGRFTASLTAPLAFRQRIYPVSEAAAGHPITVESRNLYLPVNRK